MAEAQILSVPPVEAIEFFRAKGHHVAFDWRDTDAAQHARSFTVAKAMREDILHDIRQAVDGALADGRTFRQFHNELAPLLQSKGWWGVQDMVDPKTGEILEVQLGSPHRLRTIFDTNIRMAYSKGRWDRIERVAKAMPWLRYVSVRDTRTRPDHLRWHGTVLRVDHPFWETHYPPNGWRCRCITQQLSDQDLEEFGFTPSGGPPPGSEQLRPWTNKRTGETVQVPIGIDPGFQHNVGVIGRAPPLRPTAPDPWEIPELDLEGATRQRIGQAQGSNPGGTFVGEDGVTRYVKFYDDAAQAYGEAVANRAYRELGLDAPVSSLVRNKDGKIAGIASELLENEGTLGTGRRLTKGRAQQVLRGYSADVWLANWDAVGSGLDNIVVTAKGRFAVARIDQGGSLLFRAQAGRKATDALEKLSEWDGFADVSVNRHYARVLEKAGLSSADELGRKALQQVAAIGKLRGKTKSFEKLVPKVAGIRSADRDEILKALRNRARMLETEIAPRVRRAMEDLASRPAVPAHQAAFAKEMGTSYRRFRQSAIRRTGSTPRHGMNDNELTSVYAYTTSDAGWGYYRFNQALYSRDPAQVAKFRNYRDTLNDALGKLPDHAEPVRRGTTLPPHVLAEHTLGNVVSYGGFTSSSRTHGFRGPHRFYIHSKHGKVVEPYSAHSSENEVLFKAGSKFRVLKVETKGDGTVHFVLEEVE